VPTRSSLAQRFPDTADSHFAERRRRLATSDAPWALLEMAAAMYTIDLRTDPDALRADGDPGGAEDVQAMTGFLLLRVMHRAACNRQHRAFEPLCALEARRADLTRRIEARLREAIVAALPPRLPSQAIDLRRFERVFAAFVAGEIATSRLAPVAGDDPLLLHGIPDSSNFFAWAEAALLFVRHDLHARFWRTLLPSFVCGASFFAAIYWDGSARRLDAYAGTNLPATPTTPSSAILAMLRHQHGAMDLTQLASAFTDVVGLALRDEARLPHPIPASAEFR
jgi:hypothetical protein